MRKRGLSSGFEELAEKGRGFVGEDAGRDGQAVIHTRMIEDGEAGANCAALGIVRTVDEAIDPGLEHCARAHRAGLDSDVESESRETMIPHSRCGCAQGDYFRVRGRVAVCDGTIAGAREDIFSPDDDATDRHFSVLRREARFCQRQPHVFVVKSDLLGRVAGIVHRASE